MASVFQRIIQYISTLENTVLKAFTFRFPNVSEAFALAPLNIPKLQQNNPKSQSFSELLKNSILWAVPKRRRTIEKRRCRRFGWPQYVYKPLLPKTNILICTKCGSYHEAGLLCPTCYSKVKKETEEIQEKIQAHLGISPVESEVVVLYNGEEKQGSDFFQGKRIIEMKKDRPKFFSNNLLQRSTQGPADTKEVLKREDNIN